MDFMLLTSQGQPGDGVELCGKRLGAVHVKYGNIPQASHKWQEEGCSKQEGPGPFISTGL
jgi:hypothetical protein